MSSQHRAAQPSSHPGRLKAWAMAARLHTLPASIAPVLVGSGAAVGAGRFRLDVFLAALFGALLIQVGANLANDLFDFKKGADTEKRVGFTRVTQAGLIPPGQVAFATWLSFATALLLTGYLALVGGGPILIVGGASVLAGILYTGGPWPLAYHGLGDLFAFLFFGLIAVSTTFYLHTGVLNGFIVAASLPIGFLVTAILVVNNLRDAETDREAGKMTLAVRMGPYVTRLYYTALLTGSYLVPLGFWLTAWREWWLLLPLLSLPLALRLAREILTGTEGAALNRTLASTGKLELQFALLFAISLAL